MKGTCVLGLIGSIKQKVESEKFQEILKYAGFEEEPVIFATIDVDDGVFFRIIHSTSKVLNVPLCKITEIFSDFWIHHYTQKLYRKIYQQYNSFKDLLLDLNWLHEMLTKYLPRRKPPKFEYQWENEKTLFITYKSQRNLIDLVISHAKAAAKFYNEKINITKVGENTIRIQFLD